MSMSASWSGWISQLLSFQRNPAHLTHAFALRLESVAAAATEASA